MSQIRITPRELQDGASNINRIAGEIINDLKQLKRTVDSVSHNWEGAAQSSYVQSFEHIYKEFMNTFPPTVQGLAAQMKNAGDALEQTDAQLAQAFRSK